MALIYNVEYKHTSTIGKIKIKFREWVARDEKNYLNLIEKEEKITDEMIYKTLIEPCIEDKKIVLSASQQRKLLIDIRIKSINPNLVDSFKLDCSNLKCKSLKKEEDELPIIKVNKKIESMMKYKDSSFKDITEDNITISFSPIKTNKEKSLLTLEDGLVNYVINDFLLHIDKIKIDDEMHEEISFEEKEEFMYSLPTKIFDSIFEKFQDTVDELNIEYKYKCPECGEMNTKDYTYIPNLLWA